MYLGRVVENIMMSINYVVYWAGNSQPLMSGLQLKNYNLMFQRHSFTHSTIKSEFNIYVDYVIIEKVKVTKFVGVLIDEKLNWV